jgi:hypothetical protein
MGSDTQRFAASGADSLLLQPGGSTWRSQDPLWLNWERMAERYTWILWEGAKDLPSPKILLDQGPLLSQLASIRTVIGPVPPMNPQTLWLDCPLPLSDQDSRRAAAFVGQHLDELSFDWRQMPDNGMTARTEI